MLPLPAQVCFAWEHTHTHTERHERGKESQTWNVEKKSKTMLNVELQRIISKPLLFESQNLSRAKRYWWCARVCSWKKSKTHFLRLVFGLFAFVPPSIQFCFLSVFRSDIFTLFHVIIPLHCPHHWLTAEFVFVFLFRLLFSLVLSARLPHCSTQPFLIYIIAACVSRI